MDGRERAIILGVLLSMLVGYVVSVLIQFNLGRIDLETFDGKFWVVVGFVAGLLVKLPPTKNEAEATAEAATGTNAETVEVTGEQVNVHPEH